MYVLSCRQLAEKVDFFNRIGQLLVWVQGAVMSTPAHCQILILGAALRMVTLTKVSEQSQGKVFQKCE